MNDAQQVLYRAATAALAAPSIFNTQPWAWTVTADKLVLRADRSRLLSAADPDGRLLTVSCGVAAHHAIVAIEGFQPRVGLLPDPSDPDVLAHIGLGAPAVPDHRLAAMRKAIAFRRTDRRAFQKSPIDARILDRVVAACAEQGAHLYLVAWHQITTLALAAVAAGALELSDPAYLNELADWTHRPPWSGDGVPIETAVERSRRRVPVRDFAPFGGMVMPAGLDSDFGAGYAIIHTDGDGPSDWLAAGMGLSAVLLAATAAGLGTAVISDITERAMIRENIRGVLPSGHPQVAVRLGHPQPGQLPAVPRRPASEVIKLPPAT